MPSMKDLSVEIDVAPRGLTVDICATGCDAYQVLKALGKIEKPHPNQVRVVTMVVGPVTEQKL